MKSIKLSRKNSIIIMAVSIAVAVILIVANIVTDIYSGLITVALSSGGTVSSEEGKKTCQEVEAEGIVLLKNRDGALPLSSDEKNLALIGQDSVDFVYGGAGSGSVDTANAPTLKTALEKSDFRVNTTLWDFYETGAGKAYRKQVPDSSGKGSFAVNEVPQSVYTDAVLSSMDNDDVGVVVIGRSGGESADIPTTPLASGYLYLEPDKDELDMIAMACGKFDKVIVIINSNNAMELGFLEDPAYANVKAALWVGAVGQEGMYAIGEVLSGKVNPSGRLVDTYAYDSLSAPSAQNMGSYSITNASEVTDYANNAKNYLVYQEGIYVGYKYYETRYEDAVLGQGNAGDYDYEEVVQYPFGYGLSYTEFDWSDMTVEETEDAFDISLTVTNNGGYAGKDVVEIYMQSPYTPGGIEKSAVELVGFAKTDLIEKDGSQEITVSVAKESMKAYDADTAKTYVVDAGTYYFAAGRNAHDALNNILVAKNADVDGDSELVYEYVQSERDAETYSRSAATGNAITNQFEEADANYYDECTYLSRQDWQGTMPVGAYKGGSWEAPDRMIADLNWYRADEVVNDSTKTMPEQGSTATAYRVTDLVDADYEDERWEQIVSQLSWNQVTRLVRMGGYSTIQIDAIGLPATQDKDGPSGVSGTLVGGTSTMAWPTEVVMASTWNVELMEKMGELIGEDSIGAGITGWYAPGANIHRSPYSGRNFEYYSEDGFLSGKMGAAEMRGVRSKGVIAYMKHFALNDQETDRYGNAIFATEQSIREIYLKGFELIVTEGGANAAMAAMNRIGTRWAGAHKGLMTEVLRNEWGFEGMVITDQASVSGMFYQDMISGLWAGTDLWLNTNSSYWSLDDYRDNATVMSYVHRAAKNIIYAITNSNAVQDYGSGKTGMTGLAPWQIALYIADGVLGAACIAGITVSVIALVQNRKSKEVSE